MVDENVENMSPFVGEQMEDVHNWVLTDIRNGKLWGSDNESLSLESPGSVGGHQSLSRERRKGKGRRRKVEEGEEGECRKEKR